MFDHLDPAVASLLGSQWPVPPPIQNLWESLPAESTPQTQGTSPERLMLVTKLGKINIWVPDQPGVKRPGTDEVLLEFTKGGQPAEYTLTWRQYWRQVPNSYTHIPPGGGYTKAYTTTHGISRTDSESISGELGVDLGGLGAKLQATFGHSITVSEERSEQTQYTVGAPGEGEVRVWVLWQLVDEIVALDQGNVLDFGTKQGRVHPPAAFWDEVPLSYRDVQQKFPSEIFVPMQRDFDESQALAD